MGSLNYFKFYIALLGAKSASFFLKFCTKCSGTSFPGVVAFKVDKTFLADATKFCSSDIITVTGTNGKTTTSGFIANILKTNRKNVLHNQKGANMPQGIATALALGVNPFKNTDYFVLENDEAYLSRVYEQIKADYLVVTNLFHDQSDRYGDVNVTARKIKDAIEKNPDLTIFLNADDPMLKSLYTQNTTTYGFENIELVDDRISTTQVENLFCTCGGELSYTKVFYGHIGHYSCTCGYSRPTPDIVADAKISVEKTLLSVRYEDKIFDFSISVPGVYNAYNALAAISLALKLGISPDVIQRSFDTYKSVFGRAQKIKIKGKNAFVQLIKNPAGASEAIRTVCNDKDSKLLIAVNDAYSDGRDMSWLWDSNFEVFENYNDVIFASGSRAYDLALRIKYSGYDWSKIKIEPNIPVALTSALAELKDGETLHILPCYTALTEIQNFLKKL